VSYQLEVKGRADRAPENQPPMNVAAAVIEFVTGALLENPHRVGKRCFAPLDGIWSARRGTYRILYEIDEDSKTVTLIDVKHRRDAYRS
jgi:mRNA interferase RelE/StbE